MWTAYCRKSLSRGRRQKRPVSERLTITEFRGLREHLQEIVSAQRAAEAANAKLKLSNQHS